MRPLAILLASLRSAARLRHALRACITSMRLGRAPLGHVQQERQACVHERKRICLLAAVRLRAGRRRHQIMDDCQVVPPACTPSADLLTERGREGGAVTGDCGVGRASVFLFVRMLLIALQGMGVLPLVLAIPLLDPAPHACHGRIPTYGNNDIPPCQ